VTEETFLQLCDELSTLYYPWLQWLLVAVGSCFLEDAARCGIALLVAADHMSWWLAFTGMVAGALIGDASLYLTGRYATAFLLSRRWVNPDKLVKMEGFFKTHAVAAIFLSRFVPGVRGIGFSVSGIVRYPLPRFLLVLTAASVAQAIVFLKLGNFIGDRVLPLFKGRGAQFATILAVVLVGAVIHRIFARRRKKKAIQARASMASAATDAPTEPADTAD
jgi:Uncharacterized membrane-associated protein